jgi:hypothetical protein
MDRKKHPKPHEPTAATVATPTGGQAARCQARSKRSGEQCKRPARTGYRVCHVHGAGSVKREQEGTAQRPGRPLESGIYGVRQHGNVQEMLEQALRSEVDLDNTDREMVLSRVIVANALALQPDVNKLKEALERALQGGGFTDPEAMMDAARMVMRLGGYLVTLQELNKDVVRISKMRADIIAKTAQAKALEQFIEWTKGLKVVLSESLSREQYEAVHQRLVTEVLGPLGVRKMVEA